TPHRGGDGEVAEHEPVVGRYGSGLVGEAGAEQRRVEEVARPVAREDPTRAVGTVRRGREPGHENPRLGIAEAGHRTTPVRAVAECSALLRGDLLAPRDETGARAAGDDLAVEGAQRGRTRHAVRVDFAAVRVLLVVNPAASSVTPRV